MKWFLVTTLLIAGLVWCHDDVLNNLQDHLPELPDENELQEKSEDIEKVVRDKCVKAGGEKAFEELQIEKEAVTTCFQNLVDTEQIQAEIEEAKKTGSMDEVFAKYCKKKPEFLSCFNNFTNKLDQCLVEGEKTTLKIGVNLTETLIDFACYKDGDRLAMFIAEGGQECLTDKKDVLQDCFNKTMKSILPSDISMENIPLLVIGETECRAFTNLQTCFVKELETCKDKTPANLMEALFKFIRKSLPCSTQQQQQSLTAGGGPHYTRTTTFARTKYFETTLRTPPLYSQRPWDSIKPQYTQVTRYRPYTQPSRTLPAPAQQNINPPALQRRNPSAQQNLNNPYAQQNINSFAQQNINSFAPQQSRKPPAQQRRHPPAQQNFNLSAQQNTNSPAQQNINPSAQQSIHPSAQDSRSPSTQTIKGTNQTALTSVIKDGNNQVSEADAVLTQKRIALLDLQIAAADENRRQSAKEHALRMDILKLQFIEQQMRVNLANFTLHLVKNDTANY